MIFKCNYILKKRFSNTCCKYSVKEIHILFENERFFGYQPQVFFFFFFYTDARAVSDRYHCKYVEISVVLNHNVDELLVGIVRQVRLRRNSIELQVPMLAPRKMSKSFSSKTKSFLCKLFRVGQKDHSSSDLYDL